MSSTIFFIVGGFFSYGGCTRLEDCAPTVFSVVLLWLGGFFYGGFFCGGFFYGGFAVFSDVLWWLGGFFCGALVFFSTFDGACFAAIGFFCFFGGDSGLMSISWLELTPL
jgi:hypothetical protein